MTKKKRAQLFIGLRIVRRWENVKGHCIFSIPLRGGQRWGMIFSEDWSEFFVGVFKKGWK